MSVVFPTYFSMLCVFGITHFQRKTYSAQTMQDFDHITKKY